MNLKILSTFIIGFQLLFSFNFNYLNARPNYSDSLEYVSDDDEYNLVVASYKGDINYISTLIEKGTNPNSILDHTLTPLIYAAQGGQIKACTYLISHGADVNLKPKEGTTPLIASIISRNSQITDMFIMMGSDINQGDEKGRTPLMYAIALDDSNLVKILLNKKCDLFAKDTLGFDALMVSVIHRRYNYAEMLIKLGLDVNTKDKKNITPIIIASKNVDYPMIDLLLKYGADINHVSKNKLTPLLVAIENKDEKLVEYLLSKGADAKQKVGLSQTTITTSKYFNAGAFIDEMLMDKGARQSVLPCFKKIFFGPEITFNNHQIMSGFNIGVKDFRYNSEITAGILFRLFSSRVLVPAGTYNEYYQFWERRYFAFAGIIKKFPFHFGENDFQRGLFVGLKGILSKYSYRGSDIDNQSLYTLSPEIGFFQSYRNFLFSISYQYLDFKHDGVIPHVLNVNCKFYFGKAFNFNKKAYEPWM